MSTPMTAQQHVAQVKHYTMGWLRWGWHCTCGRGRRVVGAEADARNAALAHEQRWNR